MADSMAIIEMKLIPSAVLIACDKFIFCLSKIIVSKAILVKRPFIIANVIMAIVDQGIWVI